MCSCVRCVKYVIIRAVGVNRGFNAPFVCYIFHFVCVPFAGRRNRPIAVER